MGFRQLLSIVRGRAATFVPCIALLALLLTVSGVARAEEHSIIKNPNDHPHYGVEIEPHLVLGVFAPGPDDGFGLGVRFSIPIVDNGFVPTINNNVAIGFGVDWVHWDGCFNGFNYVVNGVAYGYTCSANSFLFPVVMQWNFFLSTHFSVFGEPGLALEYRTWSSDNCVQQPNGTVICGGTVSGVDHTVVHPLVLYLGGRYHFSQSMALTVRLGYPTFSVGLSFL
jgi:hypothetical protein